MWIKEYLSSSPQLQAVYIRRWLLAVDSIRLKQNTNHVKASCLPFMQFLLANYTSSHLSTHVVNRLLRENRKSISNIFNGKKL